MGKERRSFPICSIVLMISSYMTPASFIICVKNSFTFGLASTIGRRNAPAGRPSMLQQALIGVGFTVQKIPVITGRYF